MSNIAISLFGLMYWLIMSRLVGATALGIAAMVWSMAMIAAGMASLGVNTGLFRHAGEALGRGDISLASSYLWSAVSYLIPAYGAAAFVITQLSLPGAVYTAAVVLSVIVYTFEVYLIAMYKTEVRFVAVIISGAVRIGVGVTLAKWGWVGVVLGYLAGNVVTLFIVAGYVLRHVVLVTPRLSALVEIVKAGFPTWVPTALVIMAQQAGTLSVFMTAGAAETGILYVAQAVTGLISAAAGVAVGLLTPALAAMDSGRREAAAAACRVALALSAPLAALLVAVSHVPLALLGDEFLAAAVPMAMLAAAVLPAVVLDVISSYYLAEKKLILLLLLSSSRAVLQLALYVFLVPLYGAVGAALSTFVSTSVFATAFSRVLNVGRVHLLAIAIPLAIAPVGLFLPWPLTAAAISASWLFYLRVGVLTRKDVSDIAHAILGKQADSIYRRYWHIIDRIIPER